MPERNILLLGDPVLRERCKTVRTYGSPELASLVIDLKDTLDAFRAGSGFGRGIAAPQIGSLQRVIYVDFQIQGPFVNPVITRKSRKKFRLWDDCFSFPDILVQVERFYAIEMSYKDEKGTSQSLKANGPLSELLQHEIDHLNGILAIDRAIDSKHIILRSEFNRRFAHLPLRF